MNLSARRMDRDALVAALMEAGTALKGTSCRCPYHEDRTASAGIKQGRDGVWRFNCFTPACRVGGDVFDIEARNMGLEVNEYLRQLKDREHPRSMATAVPQPPVQEARNAEGDKQALTFPSVEAMEAYYRSRGWQRTFRYTNPETGIDDLFVLRLEPRGKSKTFRQGHWRGAEIVMQRPEQKMPLYNRAGIVEARAVVVVEGEKAAEALIGIGIPATTSPMGAGNCSHSDWSPLAGKRVIIWPDNDENGQIYAQEVESRISELVPAPDIYIIEAFKDAGPKYDAADLIETDMAGADTTEKREVVRTFIDEARPTGALRALSNMLEDEAAGRRKAESLPWPCMSKLTQAMLPGTLTIIAGSPGTRKSFMLMQMLLHFQKHEVPVAAYMLEHNVDFHMKRMLSLLCGRGEIFDPEWVRRNKALVDEWMGKHRETLSRLGRCIRTAEGDDSPEVCVSHDLLLKWAEERAKAGCRIIAIDPITAADAQGKPPWEADKLLTMRLKRIARIYGCSVVIVSHPKQGKNGEAGLDGVAGGASWSRFVQTVLWVHHHAEPKAVNVMATRKVFGREESLSVAETREISMAVSIHKATNAKGAGTHLAFEFGADMNLIEIGPIVGKSAPAPKAKSYAPSLEVDDDGEPF